MIVSCNCFSFDAPYAFLPEFFFLHKQNIKQQKTMPHPVARARKISSILHKYLVMLIFARLTGWHREGEKISRSICY